MRIIDNKHDFYDYLQDSTDTRCVFDRRNSYKLTKESFDWIFVFNRDKKTYKFLLLQCGATYWLFLVKDLGYRNPNNPIDTDREYKIVDLLATWKNYNRPNYLLQLDNINLRFIYKLTDKTNNDFDPDKIRANIKDIIDAIDHDNVEYYHRERIGNTPGYYKYVPYENDTQTYPILESCGLNQFINPIEIFSAIEEYFSIEKAKTETTEAKGATNDDKIIMHGFDTKTSFRGK